MPKIQAFPTWLAINNANFTSPTGVTDLATGQPIGAGGLNAGDYGDLTNEEAANASYTTNGLLFEGRYRLVQVDSGATATNVKTGTVGYLRAGLSVKTAVILTAGSGMTAGTYTIAAANGSGGGNGAIIQVIVAANGTVTTQPVVLAGGNNYTSVPTFTMPASAGGTGATFVAQLNSTPNIVISADQQAVSGVGPVRPVVFLNSITPGNWGFIQELGTATVLDGATFIQTAGQFATVATGGSTMTTSSASVTIYTIGQVIDALLTSPPANTPFKILMGITATTVQD